MKNKAFGVGEQKQVLGADVFLRDEPCAVRAITSHEGSAPPNEWMHGKRACGRTSTLAVGPGVGQVGGYQVCHKWFKDRRGRMLSYEDIRHYQHIVAVLTETVSLMERIDEATEEYGGGPLPREGC